MLPAPHRICLALLVALAVSRPASAQSFIDTPEGRAEVIGLKRWTATMLADSLGVHAPGVSLFQTRECTKALTSRLHFSSVFIEKFVDGRPGDNAQSVVIRLVEPQDSARIRWRHEPLDSPPARAEWADLFRVLSTPDGTFAEPDLANPLGMYGLFLRDSSAARQQAIAVGFDANRAVAFWSTLRTHRTRRDRDLALASLSADGNPRNRMVAAAILANFPQSDEVWRALADGLRDPYPGVSVAAMQSLTLLGNGFARHVDWRPAAANLRAVLDGTNLPAFLSLMQVLHQTSISPALAAPLLRGGGELVLANARAADERSRRAAIALLLDLSGRTTPLADWGKWIESL